MKRKKKRFLTNAKFTPWNEEGSNTDCNHNKNLDGPKTEIG
jgi:hypothetical protein